jgi:hypothetical protein
MPHIDWLSSDRIQPNAYFNTLVPACMSASAGELRRTSPSLSSMMPWAKKSESVGNLQLGAGRDGRTVALHAENEALSWQGLVVSSLQVEKRRPHQSQVATRSRFAELLSHSLHAIDPQYAGLCSSS